MYVLRGDRRSLMRRTETEGHPCHLSTDRKRHIPPLYVYTGCK